MKSQIATALLAISLAVAAAPSIAVAASAIPVDTIDVLNSAALVVPIVGSPDDAPLSGPNILQIRFVNRGDLAATDVEFEVANFGAAVATIDDTGTFSKDAVVTHRFMNVGGPEATVSVIGVIYADGSEWSANGQSPFVSRRQAASASPVVPYIPSYYN